MEARAAERTKSYGKLLAARSQGPQPQRSGGEQGGLPRKTHQTVSAPVSPRSGVIQRMQLYRDSKLLEDPVILTNINFGIAENRRRGVESSGEYIGDIDGAYSVDNLSQVAPEIIFVHGHGMRGGLYNAHDEGEDAATLAQVVVSKLGKGNGTLAGRRFDVRVTSCHGAEGTEKEDGSPDLPSMVDAIGKAMAESGAEARVFGVKGDALSYPGFAGTLVAKSGGATIQRLEQVLNTYRTWRGENPGASRAECLARVGQLKPPLLEVLREGIQARVGPDASGAEQIDMRLPGTDPANFVTTFVVPGAASGAGASSRQPDPPSHAPE